MSILSHQTWEKGKQDQWHHICNPWGKAVQNSQAFSSFVFKMSQESCGELPSTLEFPSNNLAFGYTVFMQICWWQNIQAPALLSPAPPAKSIQALRYANNGLGLPYTFLACHTSRESRHSPLFAHGPLFAHSYIYFYSSEGRKIMTEEGKGKGFSKGRF